MACLQPWWRLDIFTLRVSGQQSSSHSNRSVSAEKMDGRVLFVGSQCVADQYLAPNQTPYRVEFAFSFLLVNGFQQYGRLVQLEPRLSEVIYHETTNNGTGWCRRSDTVSDAIIFGSLADKLPDHYGLQFAGFRNFHDEIILFDRGAAIIRQCVRRDLSWVPIATCTAQLMPATSSIQATSNMTAQLSDLVENLYECLNDDASLISPPMRPSVENDMSAAFEAQVD